MEARGTRCLQRRAFVEERCVAVGRPFPPLPQRTGRTGPPPGRRGYVTPGYGKPVVAFDAATGDVVHTYAGTENTHEIVCHASRLYLVLSEPLSKDTGTSGEIIRSKNERERILRPQMSRTESENVFRSKITASTAGRKSYGHTMPGLIRLIVRPSSLRTLSRFAP